MSRGILAYFWGHHTKLFMKKLIYMTKAIADYLHIHYTTVSKIMKNKNGNK